jgi:hypothetical protein
MPLDELEKPVAIALSLTLGARKPDAHNKLTYLARLSCLLPSVCRMPYCKDLRDGRGARSFTVAKQIITEKTKKNWERLEELAVLPGKSRINQISSVRSAKIACLGVRARRVFSEIDRFCAPQKTRNYDSRGEIKSRTFCSKLLISFIKTRSSSRPREWSKDVDKDLGIRGERKRDPGQFLESLTKSHTEAFDHK